jgi:hypothetical protein
MFDGIKYEIFVEMQLHEGMIFLATFAVRLFSRDIHRHGAGMTFAA